MRSSADTHRSRRDGSRGPGPALVAAALLAGSLGWAELHPPVVPGRDTARRATEEAEAVALPATTVADRLAAEVAGILAEAETMLAFGHADAARAILRAGRDAHPGAAPIVALLAQSFERDARFRPPVATLTPAELSGIRRLGGGSTITLRLERDGETVAVLKPDQTRLQSDYRAEIAAWRLCQLLGCSFDIPYNRPVRISRHDFELLYGRRTDARQRAYASNFADLIWRDAGGTAYLYGTEKAWVPGFTRFPIEKTSLWRAWLGQQAPLAALDEPLSEALRPLLADRRTAALYPKLLERAPELSTRELARQVSDVLAFDFLVGNWDRFSGVEAWWGVNCQFQGGRIVSIDNGAAFITYASDKVGRRLDAVERFSRQLVGELRGLDPEQVGRWLFPDPSPREEKALARLWLQREALLARIAELEERYGADRVVVL